LVVFEVKKTLTKSDFNDAYEHLSGISIAYSEYFEDICQNGFIPKIQYSAKAFAQITGRPVPKKYSDIHKMEKADAQIFYTLVQDTYSPIKIIHGYGGYKSEKGLRTAFLDFQESRLKKQGFGVPTMPNLISSEEYSIVKVTGMPFKYPRHQSGYWEVVASNRVNVVGLMIEIIWTKISLACYVNMPWGDDMDANVMAGLLSGKYIKDEATGKEGWMLSSIEMSEKELKEIGREAEWEPEVCPMVVMNVTQLIGMKGGIDSGSNHFSGYASEAGLTSKDLEQVLIDTNHFTVSDQNWITYIGGSIHVVEVNDSECALANDIGKLRLWCKANQVDGGVISNINLNN